MTLVKIAVILAVTAVYVSGKRIRQQDVLWARRNPHTGKSKVRQCMACVYLFPEVEKALNTKKGNFKTVNLAKRAFFLEDKDLQYNLGKECERIKDKKLEGVCKSETARHMIQIGRVNACWEYINPPDFCGCLVEGRDTGMICEQQKEDVEDTDTGSGKGRWNGGVSTEEIGEWPRSTSEKETCEVCQAMFSNFQAGITPSKDASRRVNDQRRDFFIVNAKGLGQNIVGAWCDKLPKDLQKRCLSLQRHVMDPYIAACWAMDKPEQFCGCIVAGNGKKSCPAA